MSLEAVRAGAGLFTLSDRGMVEVSGEDRVRWLDGMVTNTIAELGDGARSGCYALVLTRQGRLVADLHALARPEALWLETARGGVPHLVSHLEQFIVADDVVLEDRSDAWARFAVEGPAAEAVIAAAGGTGLAALPDSAAPLELAGQPCVVAHYGFSALPGRQLFAPAAHSEAVGAALLAAGASHGLVEASAEELEILRVEAGTPLLGVELDEGVLPAEARLERAISTTKGCYTGQEVVERLRSRNRVNHLLVGLRFEAEEPPPVGVGLVVDGKRSGELTSALRSPRFGAIGLGFVHSEHSDSGRVLDAGGVKATVAELPFGSGGS